MTRKRMAFLQELLDFVGLGDRLKLEWISSAEANKFVRVVTEFTEHIRALGPNPLQSLPSVGMLPGPKAVISATEPKAAGKHHGPGAKKQTAQSV